MKSGISCILFLGASILAFAAGAKADSFEEILRTAALKNGLRPTAQLFDDRDHQLAEIGRTFFESENLSLNGKISCRTCHLDEFGSADGLPNAVAIFGEGKGPERAMSAGKIVPRNTLPFWGRGGRGFDVFFWDGKVDFSNGKKLSQFGSTPPSDDPLVTAVHLPPAEVREMLNDNARVLPYVRESLEQGGRLYDAIVENLKAQETSAVGTLARELEKSPDELEFLDIARAIAAFIRSEFRLRDTKLHKFVFRNGALSHEEIEGGIIFYGKGKCANCHTGPYFSDFKFHAVAFPQLGFGKNGFGVDYGRFNVTFNSDDLYKFRTPPLFNVTKTAPYGHSGSLPELRMAVISHFDPLRFAAVEKMDALQRHEFFRRIAAAGNKLMSYSALSEEEVSKLIEFLKTLNFDQ